PLTRFQLGKFTRHRLVVLRIDVRLAGAAETIQPRQFLRCPPPAIGEQVAADAEYVAAQLLIAESADLRLQQPAEGLLRQIVSVRRPAGHAIQVGPERARVVLVAQRERAFVKTRHWLRPTRSDPVSPAAAR